MSSTKKNLGRIPHLHPLMPSPRSGRPRVISRSPSPTKRYRDPVKAKMYNDKTTENRKEEKVRASLLAVTYISEDDPVRSEIMPLYYKIMKTGKYPDVFRCCPDSPRRRQPSPHSPTPNVHNLAQNQSPASSLANFESHHSVQIQSPTHSIQNMSPVHSMQSQSPTRFIQNKSPAHSDVGTPLASPALSYYDSPIQSPLKFPSGPIEPLESWHNLSLESPANTAFARPDCKRKETEPVAPTKFTFVDLTESVIASNRS